MTTDRSRGLLIGTEVALVCVTLATVYGFRRLFVDASFAAEVMGAALVSHGLVALTRRAGWGIGRSALVSLVGLILFTSWLWYPDTTAYGVPTGATLDALRVDADGAWAVFRDVVAPAPVETGFVIALTLGIWLAAFLADWAAFRLWSPVEAVVPAGALFLFASLLGADEGRVAAACVFLGAVVAFELLHHVTKQLTTRHWINADADQGGRSLVAGGAVIGALAVLTAALVGPALPGAEDPAVIEWRDIGDDTPARVTVSPMVSIRSQLVDQPDVEVFTVESDEPAYWRLTALDQFDGDIWKSSGSFEDVSGELPRTPGPESPSRTLTQRFEIDALAALWLPAAFQPVTVDVPDAEVVYEAASSTLIVSNDRPTSDNLTYEVTSAVPAPDPAALVTDGEPPADIAERFLGLPAGFDPELTELARTITLGAADDYARALALQDWFRTNFIYDDQVALNHDIDSIEAFLEERRGYCEQFAGTYAALARSIGLPSRVAVGFTWGDQDPENPRRFVVTGRHAHAWPEVWLNGVGWVPFEPTPGRGNPQAEQITGTPAAQAAPVDGTDPSLPATTGTTPDSVPVPDTVAPAPDPETLVDTGTGTTTGAGGEGRAWWATVGLAALAAAAVGAVYGLVVITLKRDRARRRRHAVQGAGDRVRLAWTEATEHLSVAGVTKRASETHAEYVARVAAVSDLPGDTLDRLATLAAAADYADRPPSDAEAVEAEHATDHIETWVHRVTSGRERIVALLDPRPILPQRRARVVPG